MGIDDDNRSNYLIRRKTRYNKNQRSKNRKRRPRRGYIKEEAIEKNFLVEGEILKLRYDKDQ